MTFRPPPGEQVGTGRIRVDAARAIAKLREYQLADRHAWILECIRAAVAGGATAIELTGDADDVWLTWIGEPLAVADLPKLFDELVSPEADDARHHVRLLAAGVNSALGLGADVRVAVYATAPDAIWCVRYTAEVMTEAALRALSATQVDDSEIAAQLRGRRGMVVHLHRGASLAVLARFVTRAEPPELVLARAACRDVPVPVTIGTTTMSRADTSRDVVRVPLGEGLEGFVAATDVPPIEGDWHVEIELAERGVVLERQRLTLVDGPRVPMPLRGFVDATRLPTDASRSHVRQDAYPVPQAIARARAVVPDVIAALVAAAPTDERARATAIRLLASTGAWQGPLSPFGPLADAPLLRDAVGAPHPPSAPWAGVVYRGRRPLDADLAPWVTGMLWIPPGDPAELLGIPNDARASSRFIKRARAQRRAHERFFGHAPRKPEVIAQREPRVRIALGSGCDDSAIDAAVFANLTGEVCVYSTPGAGQLVVLWQGRELERVAFDTQVAFDAIIDAPELRAGDRYRSVLQDDAYFRVVAAMRAAVYRAVEVIARGGDPPRGCVLGGDPAADADLARRALAMGRLLDVPLRGPLAALPVWETVTGERVATETLARARAIGLVDPDVTIAPPRGRIVVRATATERELLGRLLVGVPKVAYHADAGTTATKLAASYLEHAACALVIDDGAGEIVVVAPGPPRLIVRHRGTRVTDSPRTPGLLQVTIDIDSDEVVPDGAWSAAKFDGGIGARDLGMYEAQYVRAVFAALAGARPANLVGDQPIEFGSRTATDACSALAAHADRIRLPADHVARLRALPIARLLGETARRTLDELAPRFPEALRFVTPRAVPAPGFVAIVANEMEAYAFAALLGKRAQDATVELDLRRVALEREARIARHREKPEVPLALPGTTAPIASAIVTRGVIGLASGTSELVVFVERRPFTTLRFPGSVAISAAVEVGVDRIDEAFEAVPADVVEAIVKLVWAGVPDLLVAIAEASPRAIGSGPGLALLVAWIAGGGAVQADFRRVMCATDAFRTVQGEYVSLDRAGEPRRVLSTATWFGDWLDHRGESPHALDAPVIELGPPGLVAVLERVYPGSVVDVTAELDKLQGNRRMSRGLVPTPVLGSIPASHKCKLADLGDLGKQLGHGEIGLADDTKSIAWIHARGRLVRHVQLDVWPIVHVALESIELAEMPEPTGVEQLRALGLLDAEPRLIDTQVQELAVRLVRKLAPRGDALTLAMRRGLARAGLAKRIPLIELAGLPCFELADQRWADGQALIDQLAKFGDAWSVPTRLAATSAAPLDDARRVFVLSPGDLEAADAQQLRVIDATEELALDARARKNRAHPATALALSQPVLARLELRGDGKTAPRGFVGLLDPAHVFGAGVRPFRDGHAFDLMPSGCAWPTVAVVEDARFVPDRTWDEVLPDETWETAKRHVREASDELLATLGAAPTSAWISARVTPAMMQGLGANVAIAGVFWLADRLDAGHRVVLVNAPGFIGLTDGTPLGGQLFAYGLTGLELDRAIADLAAVAHAQLVRTMLRATPDERCIYHAALALAMQRIEPHEAPVEFPCFSPTPLDATALVALFAGGSIDVIDTPDPRRELPALIADGTHLSRLVRSRLGRRARVPTLTMPAQAPAPAPVYVPPAPQPGAVHPLQSIATLLEHRLCALGLAQRHVVITARSGAMLWFDGTALHLDGDHPRLRALLAMHRANDPVSGDALDALAAHAVTVLNVSLAEVTDATEAAALARLLG